MGIAVAGRDPLAHQQSQIARQRRLRIVDRLVLAHHAAQLVGELAGAPLQHRVGQHLVDLNGMRGMGAKQRQQQTFRKQLLNQPRAAGA